MRLPWLRDQHGQATVEFAFVVVILMAIMAGFVDLGRAVWHYNSISMAARSGARYAIVRGSSSASPVGTDNCGDTLTALVRAKVPGLPNSGITVTCTWPDGGHDPGDEVRVNVVVSYTPIMLAFIPGNPPISMQAESRMTIAY
jgi:Flp pilus assembly protein TadG